MGLYDAILIKENHIALAGGLAKAVHAARTAQPELPVEVEVRNLDEAAYALGTGADRLLLDNMDPRRCATRCALRDENAGGAGASRSRPPAASPSRTSARSPRPASTSSPIGALTHSPPTLDFSMLLELA